MRFDDSQHVHTEAVPGTFDADKTFVVRTSEAGLNCGRTYLFQAETFEDRQVWIDAIEKTKEALLKLQESQRKWSRYKRWACSVYNNIFFQSFCVVLIVINFMLNVIEAQVRPLEKSPMHTTLQSLDLLLTILFTVELTLNLFANW